MKGADIRLEPPEGAFPGIDKTLADLEGVTRETIVHFDWTDDGLLTAVYRVSVSGSDTKVITNALDEEELAVEFEVFEMGEGKQDQAYVFVHAESTEFMQNILSFIDSSPVMLEYPIECTDKGFEMSLFGTKETLLDAYDEANEYVDITIDRIGTYEPEDNEPLTYLTARQREAMETAYEHGFYEPSRDMSYEEIADELGCSSSSANYILRRSMSVLVSSLLEESEG
ncbi:MAG: helix-turn-helix domain-containing protein [Halobacteria archaeon]|nr:helix-turn-helix domain-containing protein [Halobacteria archaeon]